MPNIKQAMKRLRQDAVRAVANRSRKSALRTWEKKFRTQIEANELDDAAITLRKTISCFDKAVKTNVIHQNKADRKKAQLNRTLKVALAG